MAPLTEDQRMLLFYWKRRYAVHVIAQDHAWSLEEANHLAFYRALFLWKRLGGPNDGEVRS